MILSETNSWNYSYPVFWLIIYLMVHQVKTQDSSRSSRPVDKPDLFFFEVFEK